MLKEYIVVLKDGIKGCNHPQYFQLIWWDAVDAVGIAYSTLYLIK